MENEQKVTWLCLEGKKFLNCIGQMFWLLGTVWMLSTWKNLCGTDDLVILVKMVQCFCQKDLLPGIENADLEFENYQKLMILSWLS